MDKTILDIKQIRKSFNGLEVLKDVNFRLQRGSITALFGENGCGKSTLFNIITGFLRADTGEVIYNGTQINHKRPVEISRLGLGRVWQTPRICHNLTVTDNLMLASKSHPGSSVINYLIRPQTIISEEKSRKTKAESVAEQVGLSGKLGKTAGSLSFGQRKLLSIGMLLMYDSELLLLDEPFAGINETMIEDIVDVLSLLKQKGKTICMIEHNQMRVTEISDKVFYLKKGRIVVPQEEMQ